MYGRRITCICLGALLLPLPSARADLIAHFTFEPDTVSGTTVYDQSTAGESEQSAYGGAIVSDARGYSDVLQLSTSGNSFRVGDGVGAGKNFTVAGWYKGNPSDPEPYTEGYIMDQGSPRFIIGIDFTAQEMKLYDGNWNFTGVSEGAVRDGTWHHWAVSVTNVNPGTSSDANLYIDGQLEATVNFDTEPQLSDNIGGSLRFGKRYTASGGDLYGQYDDIRFYDEALDDAAIASIYAPAYTNVWVGVNIDRSAGECGGALPNGYVNYTCDSGDSASSPKTFTGDYEFGADGHGGFTVEVTSPYFRSTQSGASYGDVTTLHASGNPLTGYNAVINSIALCNGDAQTITVTLSDLATGHYHIKFWMHEIFSIGGTGLWDISGTASAEDVAETWGCNSPVLGNNPQSLADIGSVELTFDLTPADGGQAVFNFAVDTLDGNQIAVNAFELAHVVQGTLFIVR